MINSKLVPIIVVVVLLGLSHGLAYWSGQSAERQDQQLAAVTRERDDNAAINDLQQQLRRAESAGASQLLAAETRYQKGLLDVQTQKARILAGHAAGTARLSVPVKAASCTAASPAANLAGDGADPAPRAELSNEAAEFLVGLAAEADAVAVELNRCADRVDMNERLLIKEEGS
ncbi:lysis system i-spanin subunit Rz [Vogesella sp. AC12]|uniref:lysis system i-spanin subunit Rz n=1 Tax=Vogesella sp. AC12 TaxID=2950550 RepID=UPI00210D40F9|nr:lysis system i-spanin subunit Rz [Vogesella sp. AC12]MCQ4143234.1 lysis protein [Vogesella sp. AC12]